MASRDTLDGARLREFVPLLVEREARDVLALMDASLRAGEDGCGR